MTNAMSIHRYIAERREGGISIEQVDAHPQPEDDVMMISIAGTGDPDALAREAAESHFARHPERKKALVLASSRSASWNDR